MDIKILGQKVRAFIAKDDIEKAIELLTEYNKKEDQIDKLVLQSGRYISLKKDKLEGIVDYEKTQQSFNQLRANILEFIKSIEQGDNLNNPAKNIVATLKSEYQLSVARIVVLKLLTESETGLSISELFQLSQLKSRKYVVKVLQELEAVESVEKTKVNNNTFWKLSKKGLKLAKIISPIIFVKSEDV